MGAMGDKMANHEKKRIAGTLLSSETPRKEDEEERSDTERLFHYPAASLL
jgi:hypothetical protein